MEAEVGVMWSQAQDAWNHQSWKREGRILP